MIHVGALGDLVLSLHIALRIPRIRETGGITIISRATLGDLSRANPPVFHRNAETSGLSWLFQDRNGPPPDVLSSAVRDRRVLSFLSDAQSPIHARLAMLHPRAIYSIDPRLRADWNSHITDQWANDLAGQGLLLESCTYKLRGAAVALSQESIDRGRQLLHAHTGTERIILIHPGSGGRDKCWPLSRFLELAKRLIAENEHTPFIIGPAEVERWPSSDITAIREVAPLVTAPSADDLLTLAAASTAFIGNDSGVTHLAALLGRPTVVLFGPTSAQTWSPLGGTVRLIHGNPTRDAQAWGITVESVYSVVQEVLRNSADIA